MPGADESSVVAFRKMGTDADQPVRRWPPRSQAVLGLRLMALAVAVLTSYHACYTVAMVTLAAVQYSGFRDGVTGLLARLGMALRQIVYSDESARFLWWVFLASTVLCVVSAWLALSVGPWYYRLLRRAPR